MLASRKEFAMIRPLLCRMLDRLAAGGSG
jgi:hypothetical protein